MLKSRLLIVLGIALIAIFVFGGAARLVPSLRDDPAPPKALTFQNWTVRADLGVPKNKKRPRMRCGAAVVIDNKAGEIVYARKAHERRPIASLTKLLTALVFLQSQPDLSARAQISSEDARNSSRSRLPRGETATLRDFLHAALMSSDNRAARLLSRSTGVSREQFIARMNTMAQALGMDSTHVVEPTGLSELNISTAHDCAILVNAALDNHLIQHITTQREYHYKSLSKRRRNRRIINTNRLLASRIKFDGAKTGYIRASGWCIAGRAHSRDGDDITAVVLGAPTEGSRFRALRDAFLWAFKLPEPKPTASDPEKTDG
jgi:D-alanyl-D-alanine endopeptidase (penicillin-binding protein 7)